MTEFRTTSTALLLLAALATPPAASAQLSFEGRVGSALPAGELTNTPGLNQSAGFSFAVDGMWSVSDRVTIYGGVARQDFSCDGCSTDVSTTGFDLGIKLPLREGIAVPWVRGGLMLHRAAVDGVDQDWGVGVDAGVGLDWDFVPSLALVPAVRMNSYGSGPVSLTYVTLDLGLHFHPENW